MLWDRYVASAYAYRRAEIALGRSGLLDEELVTRVNASFPAPALTVYLDVSVDSARKRRSLSGKPETYDATMLQQVQREYDRIGAELGAAFVRVDAEGSASQVEAAVRSLLSSQFSGTVRG